MRKMSLLMKSLSSKMRSAKRKDCDEERREEKERATTRVRCLREGVWIDQSEFGQTHAYSHERETVRM